MGTAIVVIIVILVIVVILALVLVGAYNGFVKSRNVIQESWRQVDVELNRRYELIPNLVETVRAFASHERNTLEDVTRLRNQAQSMSQQEGGTPSEQRADVEEQLSGAVRNLMVSVEAYPDLKSNQNFLELQKQLTETEDRIAAGRRFYNANVRVYNTKVESVPSNIVANAFHFEKATYFEVHDQAVRQAPDVNFGEIAYRGDDQGQGGQQQGQLPQQQSAPPANFGGQGQQDYQQQGQPQQAQQPYGQQGQQGQQQFGQGQQSGQQGQPGQQSGQQGQPGQQHGQQGQQQNGQDQQGQSQQFDQGQQGPSPYGQAPQQFGQPQQNNQIWPPQQAPSSSSSAANPEQGGSNPQQAPGGQQGGNTWPPQDPQQGNPQQGNPQQ